MLQVVSVQGKKVQEIPLFEAEGVSNGQIPNVSTNTSSDEISIFSKEEIQRYSKENWFHY